ncbi:MAG: hypothetical protein QM346_10775 [Chloroflexota bacterium]|nr:hypothetical protein [Chloroflexota bacterium]
MGQMPLWVGRVDVLAAAALAALLLLSWALVRCLRRRRLAALYAALADSVASRLVLRGKLGARGFAADYEPAPAPFRSLSVRVDSGGRRGVLVFAGTLPSAPLSEIIWVRNTPPLNALGANPGAGVWTSRRLDVAAVEYATRGDNPSAISYEFQDLLTRLGPSLLRVSVQQDRTPHLEVHARITALTGDEIGPLVRAVRSLARAAQIA